MRPKHLPDDYPPHHPSCVCGCNEPTIEQQIPYPELVKKLVHDALEINKDDPGFGLDYDNFLSVMWENDDDLQRLNVDRETYAEALRDAWVTVF